MSESESTKPGKTAVSLAVLGVVYGDLGTSPIYALRTCFRGVNPVTITEANILGILSLIFWSLILVISIKYMMFVLRANNRGEGGMFALLALLRPDEGQDKLRRRSLIVLGLFGAGLLYGGTMLTPAITVLSAVEGLKIAAPGFGPYVIPATVAILFGLFAVQRFGTARVGTLFGPIMVLWFLTLAALGLMHIVDHPEVLKAVMPWYAVTFMINNQFTGFLVLIGVFLTLTGGEALYADLGHFGPTPIRLVWFCFVLPALLINYFGQGALLLSSHHSTLQPFFHLAPDWALYPLILLTTAATVIASQAVITGAFSLTRQAMQLGFVPHLQVKQTSEHAHGQIYMPAVNWLLMIAAVALVLTFRSSASLASAYGLSVNATMLVTTILTYNVARREGGWTRAGAIPLLLLFLLIDGAFLAANLDTIPYGGWFPIAAGAVIFTVILTWRRGNELLVQQYEADAITMKTLVGRLQNDPPNRGDGVGIFFVARAEEIPRSLLQLVKLTRMLPENILIVNVRVLHVPFAPPDERSKVESFGEGVYSINLRYGFMQGFNVPSDLAQCIERGELPIDLSDATYYVDQTSVIAGRKQGGMMVWRDSMFAFMKRNTMHVTSQFRIPADRVMEIGLQLGI